MSDLLFIRPPRNADTLFLQGPNDEDGAVMEVIHPRCAGIDISKKDAKVCIRVQGRGARSTASTVTTWGAMTGQILDLKEHLLNEHVTLVVMEATSDYWRPFYYLLEDEGLNVVLVNARDARNVPGRKTDVSDAAWLADLGAHGLVRASFVPPPPIRELRDLTRARTIITRERSRKSSAWRNCSRTLHQVVLGGLRHHRGLRTADALGPHRRAKRSGGPGRPGPAPDAFKDPRAHGRTDRPVQQPPPLHGRTVPAPDRRPQPGHQRPYCQD